jgi:tetratricopeptide (TPR) repeat protein
MRALRFLVLAAAIGVAAPLPAMAATHAPVHASPLAAMLQQVAQLQHDWAVANYQTPEKDKQGAFEALVARASKLTAAYPGAAQPKVWEAIIRAGYAGSMGGLQSMFSAMPQMKQGRDLLLAAEKIDPTVMHGAVYTTLGSFYYMVPGGFIGFGDDDKALAYLKKGLALAPEDMDANYFMGDYWLHEKKYAKAVPCFEKVLALPDVASRPIYSKGRKAEAAAKLAEARKHIH